MSTIRHTIENSTLNDRCRIDLLGAVEELERHCVTLPKREPTTDAPYLPSCTFATTVSRSRKSHWRPDEAAVEAFRTEKLMSTERTAGASLSSSTYFKRLGSKFSGVPPRDEPFRRQRDRQELSGAARDFVRRYAEAAAMAPIGRPADDGPPAQTAAEAYRRAFSAYRGRDPTAREMEEADRLFFAFAEDGTVGVVQKPHFHGPHAHVSICNRRPARCASQVYRAELPPVRAARDRFPGPIPVWSSTKNLHTMVASDVHVPGLHNVSKLRTADIK